MKIPVVLCLVLLVIITVSQLHASNTKRVNQGVGQDLFSDNGIDDECCQQNGSDVDIKKPGLLEVMLDGDLVFEVCSMNCDGDFLVCYEGDSPNPNGTDLCDSKCAFYISAKDNKISFMMPIDFHNEGQPKKNECDSIVMTDGYTFFRNHSYPSCSPKIAENGLVKLNVLNASSECPVSIKNATIKPKATTAPPTILTTISAAGIKTRTKSGRSGNETTTSTPGGFFETYWWIFLIIGILGLVIAAGIVIYCLKCKKPKKPTPTPPATLRMPQGPQSPAVLQTSAENVKSRGLPSSILNPSSILSHKSLLEPKNAKEEEKQDETDLASLKPTA